MKYPRVEGVDSSGVPPVIFLPPSVPGEPEPDPSWLDEVAEAGLAAWERKGEPVRVRRRRWLGP